MDAKVSKANETYAGHLDRLTAANGRRLDAVARAEAACRTFAAALRDVMVAAAEEHAASSEMNAIAAAFEAPGNHSVGALTQASVSSRLWSYTRGVLRSALGGGPYFGPVAIAAQPGDIDPALAWSPAEQTHGDEREFHRRRQPA